MIKITERCVEVKQLATKLLQKYGHQLEVDGWYNVLHGEKRDIKFDYVDAFSIKCNEASCNIKFDINTSDYDVDYGPIDKKQEFLLWRNCGGIARYVYNYNNLEIIETKEPRLLPLWVCKKLQVLA